MPQLPPMLVAALTGFISGLLICIPVGPVNLAIINQGARNGFRWAAMIGLGAVTMESVYCTLAFTGFASFFQKGVVKSAMELTSFVFMLFLGMRFLTARAIPTAGAIETRVQEKLHPHSAFMTGFVRVMGNPGVLLLWIVLAAHFMAREWVAPDAPSRFACVGGVALGAGLWFTCLSYFISLRGKKISEQVLLRIEQFSGVCLLAVAVYDGGHIIWEMARQYGHRF